MATLGSALLDVRSQVEAYLIGLGVKIEEGSVVDVNSEGRMHPYSQSCACLADVDSVLSRISESSREFLAALDKEQTLRNSVVGRNNKIDEYGSSVARIRQVESVLKDCREALSSNHHALPPTASASHFEGPTEESRSSNQIFLMEAVDFEGMAKRLGVDFLPVEIDADNPNYQALLFSDEFSCNVFISPSGVLVKVEVVIEFTAESYSFSQPGLNDALRNVVINRGWIALEKSLLVLLRMISNRSAEQRQKTIGFLQALIAWVEESNSSLDMQEYGMAHFYEQGVEVEGWYTPSMSGTRGPELPFSRPCRIPFDSALDAAVSLMIPPVFLQINDLQELQLRFNLAHAATSEEAKNSSGVASSSLVGAGSQYVWTSITNYCTQGYHISRIPLSNMDCVPLLLRYLRRAWVFDALVQSCSTSSDVVVPPSIPPFKIAITCRQPYAIECTGDNVHFSLTVSLGGQLQWTNLSSQLSERKDEALFILGNILHIPLFVSWILLQQNDDNDNNNANNAK
jgi:hypothetical protein